MGGEKKFKNFLPFFHDSFKFLYPSNENSTSEFCHHLVRFSQYYEIYLEIGNENGKPDGKKQIYLLDVF